MESVVSGDRVESSCWACDEFGSRINSTCCERTHVHEVGAGGGVDACASVSWREATLWCECVSTGVVVGVAADGCIAASRKGIRYFARVSVPWRRGGVVARSTGVDSLDDRSTTRPPFLSIDFATVLYRAAWSFSLVRTFNRVAHEMSNGEQRARRASVLVSTVRCMAFLCLSIHVCRMRVCARATLGLYDIYVCMMYVCRCAEPWVRAR